MNNSLSVKEKLIRFIELTGSFGLFDKTLLFHKNQKGHLRILLEKGREKFSNGIFSEETLELLEKTGSGLYLKKSGGNTNFPEMELFPHAECLYINNLLTMEHSENLLLYTHFKKKCALSYDFIKELDSVSEGLNCYLKTLSDSEINKIKLLDIKLNPEYSGASEVS